MNNVFCHIQLIRILWDLAAWPICYSSLENDQQYSQLCLYCKMILFSILLAFVIQFYYCNIICIIYIVKCRHVEHNIDWKIVLNKVVSISTNWRKSCTLIIYYYDYSSSSLVAVKEAGSRGLLQYGQCVQNPSEMKYCKISIFYSLSLIQWILLKFCTEQGSVTAVLCVNFQKDS